MDNVTQVLAGINRSIDTTVSAFEKMDGSTGASFREVRASIAQTGAQLDALTADLQKNNTPLKQQNTLWAGMKGKIAGAVGAYAGFQGVKNIIGLSDAITQTTARLDMMNDGAQSTEALTDQIYASANRARGGYLATADAVSKLGTMAGDAFNSSSEIIAFTEQLNKHFTIAGTSIEGQEAAMLQLTQAMGSGVLRGEELNSVLEQAPNIVQTIAEYMGKPKGEIRALAEEGKITASVVKNAMLSFAGETNKEFGSMPKTFGQTWMEIKNAAAKSFEGISVQLSEALNGAQVQQMVQSLITALPGAIDVVSQLLSVVMQVGSFIADHWSVIGPIVAGVATSLGTLKVITTVAQGFNSLKTAISTLNGLGGIFKIFSAGPLVIAIAAIAGLVVGIMLLWKKCEGFRNAVTTIFGGIVSVLSGVWEGIKTGAATAWNVIKTIIMVPVNLIKTLVVGAFRLLKAGVLAIWNGIKAVAGAVWKGIKTVIIAPVRGIVNLVKSLFKGLFNAIKAIFNGVKSFVSGAWNAIKDTAVRLVTALKDKVIGGFKNMVDGIKRSVSKIKEAVSGAIQKAIDWVKDKISSFVDLGGDIMDGLKRGITGAFDKVKDAVSGAVDKLKSIFTLEWKIGSPSKWMKQIGRWIMEGLTIGIDFGTPQAAKEMYHAVNAVKNATADFVPDTSGASFAISPVQASEVKAAVGATYTNNRSEVTDNRKFQFDVTVNNAADEDRLINKLVRTLEADVFSGAKGVYL